MSSDLSGAQRPLGSFVDKLTIETPEQTALEFVVAGIGSRFIAIAIDILIQIAAGTVVMIALAFGSIQLEAYLPKTGLWGVALMILFLFVLYFGYYAIFEIVWNGQTPGKRISNIRVIKDSGRPLTPAETIGRNLMRIVDWMPSFYAIGVVSMLINKQNKRLGDLLVGSLVVREATLTELRPVWQTAQEPGVATLAPMGAALLTTEEVSLIESYLQRRLDLDPMLRYRMADDIFRRLSPKLTIPPDNTLSADRLLDALSYERRATGRY
ncbi:MAG: RDD family protein [Candidatus Acidiferrales bacterium]